MITSDEILTSNEIIVYLIFNINVDNFRDN